MYLKRIEGGNTPLSNAGADLSEVSSPSYVKTTVVVLLIGRMSRLVTARPLLFLITNIAKHISDKE